MKFIPTLILVFVSHIGFSQNDTLALVKKAIDLKEFQIYLHPELPERNQLIIADEGIIPTNLQITKFGKKVVFKTKPEIFLKKIETAILFQEFKITGSIANISFNYPIEGIIVKITFQKENNIWKITNSSVTEK